MPVVCQEELVERMFETLRKLSDAGKAALDQLKEQAKETCLCDDCMEERKNDEMP